MPGYHIIIVGGVSVNDPDEHDKYPYNFIDPGVMRAKEYMRVDPTGKVVLLLFTPPYEKRVMFQGKKPAKAGVKAMPEHPDVKMTEVKTCTDFFITEWCTTERNIRHFTDVATKSAAKAGFPLVEVTQLQHVVDQLATLKPIATIDYFGHSSADEMFLSYNTNQSHFSGGEVTWGRTEASKVPLANFAPGARFYSFGCYQGNVNGLAQQLQTLWPGVTTYGSDGFSHFQPIGEGKPFPRSTNGWFKYPAWSGKGKLPDRDGPLPESALKAAP